MKIRTSTQLISRRMRRAFGGAALAAVALVAAPAWAANFLPEPAWNAVDQRGSGLADVKGDGQNNGRDIVGTTTDPAIFFATDLDTFYVRLRLDDDPRQGTALAPYAWGILIDTDGDLRFYEYSLQVNAKNPAQVELYQNTTKTGGAKDPAETQKYVKALDLVNASATPTPDLVGNYRVSKANTNIGGDDDFFLDFAIPLSELDKVGIKKDTPIVVWGGTSSSGHQLDLDLAGVNGAPANAFTLAASDPTTLTGNPPGGSGLDSDNDGVPNLVEALLGTDPNKSDSDGDGIPDNVELTPAGAADPGKGPFVRVDTDGDGTPDALDLDSDNDCASDQAEGTAGYRNANATPDANCSGATPKCDTDTGKCSATCATDANCAGAGRVCDDTSKVCTDGCRGGASPKACAAGFTCSSTTDATGTCSAVDTDGDGVPDSVETTLGTDPTKADSDGDGITDNVELSASGSNGPFSKIDTDRDGKIDALDTDSDNDCLPDASEHATYRDATKPGAADANCSNGQKCDLATGTCGAGGGTDAGTTDPNDPDGDGLTNEEEGKLGTDPNKKDTDGDGIDDGVEVGTDRNNPKDTDGDGVIDALDPTNGVGSAVGSLEGGGCSCSTPGSNEGTSGSLALALVTGLAVTGLSRRKRRD